MDDRDRWGPEDQKGTEAKKVLKAILARRGQLAREVQKETVAE
jgi:hypothetical protein